MKIPDKSFEPLGDLVCLKLNEPQETKAGLIMPDVTKARIGKGEQINDEAVTAVVVAAGAQCRYVQRGDTVIVSGQLTHFTHKGERLHVARESTLIGIESGEDGIVPLHEVTDWKTGIVERV